MSRTQVEFIYNMTTLTLVAILGYFVWLPYEAENVKANRRPAAVEIQTKSLNPSADNSNGHNSLTGVQVISVDCHDNSITSFQVPAYHVRIQAQNCIGASERIIAFEVINKTNGYTGQLMRPKSERLTTDYLRLHPGRNEIVFRLRLETGTTYSQTFNVHQTDYQP